MSLASVSRFAPLAPSTYSVASAFAAAPPDMQLIPAGEFLMGSAEELAWPEERPAHKVRLSHGFLFDGALAKDAQFEHFARATGYKTAAQRPIQLQNSMRHIAPGTAPPPKQVLQPGFPLLVAPSGQVEGLS